MLGALKLLPLLLVVAVAVADEAKSAGVLPAMHFRADPVGNEFFGQLQQAAQFRNLSREAYGSPIELRVYHTFQMSAGGRASGVVSGLLAAGTLGIVPQMYSGDHAIEYVVLVNGTELTKYSYHRAISRARNMWTQNDTTHGLGKEGFEWAGSTVAQFLAEAAHDPKLAALVSEYEFYFAPAKP